MSCDITPKSPQGHPLKENKTKDDIVLDIPSPDTPEMRCTRNTRRAVAESVCSLIGVFILIGWVATAASLYARDLQNNVASVDATIITNNTFKPGYIYTVSYEFEPLVQDTRKFKGTFCVAVDTPLKQHSYNSIYAFGSKLRVYYRKTNPDENDISRRGMYDEGLLANVILSGIAAGIGIPILLCITFWVLKV